MSIDVKPVSSEAYILKLICRRLATKKLKNFVHIYVLDPKVGVSETKYTGNGWFLSKLQDVAIHQNVKYKIWIRAWASDMCTIILMNILDQLGAKSFSPMAFILIACIYLVRFSFNQWNIKEYS